MTKDRTFQVADVNGAGRNKVDKIQNPVAGTVPVVTETGNLEGSDVPLDQLARIDGSYEQLYAGSAGVAENLQGRGSVPAEYTRRTSGGSADIGSGSAAIERLKGNSLAWNQLVAPSATTISLPSGRKYLSVIDGVEAVGTSDGSAIAVTGGVDQIFDLTLMFGPGHEPATVDEFRALFPLVYYDYDPGRLLNVTADGIVTEGFNAYDPATGKALVLGGNEYQITGAYTGITLDGEAITPDADGHFTPANDGELTVTGGNATDTCVHLVWSGYRDGEFEQHWQSELDLPITTMTGKLNGEGESVVIFPDGMAGAGSAFDYGDADAEGMIREVHKVMGRVDMGTLGWELIGGAFQASIPNSARTINRISAKYGVTRVVYSSSDFTNLPDKSCATNISSGNWPLGALLVKDSDYATAAAFKAAMNGVIIEYELATPETYVLDTPIPTNYGVDDFGTESITPENTSVPTTAPIRYDVRYAMNAVDAIRRLPQNYISKESFDDYNAKMAALLSSLTGKTVTIEATYDEEAGKYVFTMTAVDSEEPVVPGE